MSMEPADFYLVVLPLASLIAILVTTTFYYARKEEKIGMRLSHFLGKLRAIRKEIGQSEDERKLKTQDEEFDRLKELVENGSIDRGMYERLRKLVKRAQMIEAGYEHIASDPDGKMYFRRRGANETPSTSNS